SSRQAELIGSMPKDAQGYQALLEADLKAVESYDPSVAADLFGLMVRDSVYVCPTLTDAHAYTVMREPETQGDARLDLLPAAVRKTWIDEATAMTEREQTTWQDMFSAALTNVGRMHKAGVKLLAGTDAGSSFDFPGSDLHNELAL